MSASGLSEAPQGTVVGNSKPLHRFLRAQPKAIGTAVLVLGACMVLPTVSVMADLRTIRIWPAIPGSLVLGLLCVINGILYILTEHNPTKKTVTISLALSIVSILVAVWISFRSATSIGQYYRFRSYDVHDYDENGSIIETDYPSSPQYHVEDFLSAFEAIMLIYGFAGAIIFIVMSAFAGAALKSSKTQAVIVMTSAQRETPVE